MIERCVIAVDLLKNDDLFVTSNWWGQSWGRTCEPVRLTKLGTCLTHPTSLPYTRTRIVAGQRLVGYTTPLPGNPPRPAAAPLPTIGVKKEGACLPARLPLNAFTAIQAVGMPERFVQLSPFAIFFDDSGLL